MSSFLVYRYCELPAISALATSHLAVNVMHLSGIHLSVRPSVCPIRFCNITYPCI